MLILLLIPLLALMLVLPVFITVDAAYGEGLQYAVTVKYAGIRHAFRRKQGSGSTGKRRALKFVLKDLRHLKIRRFDALAMVYTGSAASSALIAGGLDAIARIPALARVARIRVLPDFFRRRQFVQIRCMFSIRLGMLIAIIITAFLRHREESKWNTPSAA